jgi:hypothetical protein
MMPDNQLGRLYFTPSIEVANGYIISQADNATGSYGHIYKVEIDNKDLIFTDDIDQSALTESVLYCIDDDYYRIDLPEKYNIIELTDNEIFELL